MKKGKSNEEPKYKKFLNKKYLPVLAVILFLAVVIILSFSNFGIEGNVITGEFGDDFLEDDLDDAKYRTSLDKDFDTTFRKGTSSGGGGFISNLFADWSEGNVDVNIAKYLFFFMLILFIFSILNLTAIPSNTAIQWLISIMVSFLATAYITPREVYAVLTTYTALGLTFSVIIPFIILLLASSAILSPIRRQGALLKTSMNRMSVGKVAMVFMVWVLYTGFLIYKFFTGYSFGQQVGMSVGVIIVLVLGVISFFIVIFNDKFRRWIFKIGKEIKLFELDMARTLRDESKKDLITETEN